MTIQWLARLYAAAFGAVLGALAPDGAWAQSDACTNRGPACCSQP